MRIGYGTWKGLLIRRTRIRTTIWISIITSFATLALSACSEATTRTGIPSALDTRGAAAANIANLWWLMFVLGTLVFLFVTGLLIYSLFRRRRYQPGDGDGVERDVSDGRSWIWYGGVILPAVILTVVLFFSLQSLRATANPGQEAAVEVEIIGRQWFWDIRYVNDNFITSNEMYVPVGQPVLLRLTSADVIHSFWVPQLHGKVDLIPGRTNTFWIQADQPGVYRGICAEFCGVQHARMQFILVAVPEDEYNQWVVQQSQPAAEAGADSDALVERGREVFVNGDCAFCHTVRGTEADGKLGPELTHFASRLTIAAGTLPNNRGNLGAWVSDPQHIKPGSLMPASNLTSEELIAVLAFLESLK